MQSGKNGVPGNSHHNHNVDPTPKHHLEKSVPQDMTPNKYGNHTSTDITAQTIPNIKNVLQSCML